MRFAQQLEGASFDAVGPANLVIAAGTSDLLRRAEAVQLAVRFDDPPGPRISLRVNYSLSIHARARVDNEIIGAAVRRQQDIARVEIFWTFRRKSTHRERGRGYSTSSPPGLYGGNQRVASDLRARAAPIWPEHAWRILSAGRR